MGNRRLYKLQIKRGHFHTGGGSSENSVVRLNRLRMFVLYLVNEMKLIKNHQVLFHSAHLSLSELEQAETIAAESGL